MNWLLRLRWLFRRVSTQDIDQAVAVARDAEDWRHILWLCNRHLKRNPRAVPVVLMRARCYQVLQLKELQRKEVELAHALDDTFVPAIFHQVGLWVEDKQTEDALRVIGLIKDHPAVKDGVNSMLGTLASRRAQANLASEYMLRAWMSNFDNIRYANSFLFSLAYAEVSEQRMASEHSFWAQTLLPYSPPDSENTAQLLSDVNRRLAKNPENIASQRVNVGARMRIGYWGGDFKEHSVRYFFRPLLEGHDRSKVELFVYDDNFMDAEADHHTQAIRKHSDHFFTTSKLADDEVVILIRSHGLDVLVDLQGHTSANRLHLWQAHLAKVQMTGLAYPPTTGLPSMDYKFVDRHMVNDEGEHFYSEHQLVFPESFWCFDPKSDVPYNTEPPYRRVGYLVLGCWGNAAKISQSMMRAWAAILQQAPEVRLSVVSHTFGDALTERAFSQQLLEAGVPMERTTCRGAYSLDELWLRYQEVDLMLDTFPFNGGTTSCWALFAGVPVLTLAGRSLQSRMGQSMMNNLGFPEFVVHSFDTYVTRALDLIRNPHQLDAFRAVARQRFRSTALGDGQRFASQFEALCQQAVTAAVHMPDLKGGSVTGVPPLSLEEMLRRARMVRYHGQIEAFDRILSIARHHYGADTRIADFQAEHLLGQAKWTELEQLQVSVDQLTPYLLHAAALMSLLQEKHRKARDFVQRFLDSPLTDVEQAFGSIRNFQLQQALWQAWLKVHSDAVKVSDAEQAVNSDRRWLVLIVSREKDSGALCVLKLQQLLGNRFGNVAVRTCGFWERVEVVNELLSEQSTDFDHVLLMRDHVELGGAGVFKRLEQALQQADVVSPAGALRWTQKDWSQDLPCFKQWGLMRPSAVDPKWLELHFAGDDVAELTVNAQVLDGQLLAINPLKLKGVFLSEDLEEAGYWAEEDWTHRLAQNGTVLAIHRGLGVIVHPSSDSGNLHTSAGLQKMLIQLNIDPLTLPEENFEIQTVHVPHVFAGMAVSHEYLKRS